MASTTFLSIADYLATDYSPDCDYVDGLILERNLGEHDHAKVQKKLLLYLAAREKQWNIYAIQEQRIRVSATRFRVPDTCVVAGPPPEEQVFTRPPFLCIEILSPEDRMDRMQERIDDYLAFGVKYVWVLNPRTRRAWSYTSEGMTEAKDGVLRTENPPVVLPLSEVF
jgi:Uma2 family endonuclease